MTQDSIIVIHTFGNIQEASLAMDMLKANGISCFLEDENPVGLNPLGGAELKIFSKDREKAQTILQDKMK